MGTISVHDFHLGPQHSGQPSGATVKKNTSRCPCSPFLGHAVGKSAKETCCKWLNLKLPTLSVLSEKRIRGVSFQGNCFCRVSKEKPEENRLCWPQFEINPIPANRVCCKSHSILGTVSWLLLPPPQKVNPMSWAQ